MAGNRVHQERLWVTLESTTYSLRTGTVEDSGFVADAGVRRNRLSQPITCQLLVLFEASLVATAALISLSNLTPSNSGVLAADAIFIGTIVFLSALITGGAGYDKFSSRLALFPGAMIAGLSAILAARFQGADHIHSLYCGAIIFSSVYAAKLPTNLLRGWLVRHGYLTRLAAVVATDLEQRGMLVQLLRRRDDIRIVFASDPKQFLALSSLSQANQLDEIVLSGHEADEEDIEAFAGLAVTLVRVTPQDRLEKRVFDPIWGRKVVFGPWSAPAAIIAVPPLRGWQGVAKRAVDIAGAACGIVLLSPILLACAIAIKLENPGPVFFTQERAGYRNKPFRMLKFRSMYTSQADATGSQLTSRNDPRVTKVGALLRRTSADELPQLFNVLAGDMSLVGPRPHPKGAKAGMSLYDDLIPNFYSRYRMKPGITGLAQVNGLRGNTETEQHLIDRFRLDLEYASQWTPLVDVAIIVRTIVHLWKGTNAF
jgi:exopolysaccharide biosynthesis polyprenyl glycosylphosphotransferase